MPLADRPLKVEPDLDCRETGCESGVCVAVAPGQYECQETSEPEPEPQPPNECGEWLQCVNACYGNRRAEFIDMCAESCDFDRNCFDGCMEPVRACEAECEPSDEVVRSAINLERCMQERCADEANWTACAEENCPEEVQACGPIPDGFFDL